MTLFLILSIFICLMAHYTEPACPRGVAEMHCGLNA